MPDTASPISPSPADASAGDISSPASQAEAGAPPKTTLPSPDPGPASAVKARSPRRKKPIEPVPASAVDLFEADLPALAPGDAAQDALPRPRGRPRRRPAGTDTGTPKPSAFDIPPGPGLAASPAVQGSDAVAVLEPASTYADEPSADVTTLAKTAVQSDFDVAQPAETAKDPDTIRHPPHPPQDAAVPAPEMQGPPVIGAADAGLTTVNPHPIRATDRPDSYLYHLTSPAEAQMLMQAGLPCSIDDPLILTERGGIPYWMAVLAEDVDDILDGPVAVAVLRVKRRAVQNYLEPDADSTRAAQAPCFLLTGMSGLAPVPAQPAPPPRAKPVELSNNPVERGTGVEMAGTVKWYNPRKGFGFITPGGGGKDVFVHASTLERSGLSQLNDGQGVRMQVVQGAKGPEAATLTLS